MRAEKRIRRGKHDREAAADARLRSRPHDVLRGPCAQSGPRLWGARPFADRIRDGSRSTAARLHHSLAPSVKIVPVAREAALCSPIDSLSSPSSSIGIVLFLSFSPSLHPFRSFSRNTTAARALVRIILFHPPRRSCLSARNLYSGRD